MAVRHGPASAPRAARIAMGVLLIALVAQAGVAALRDSVTTDEFVGLPVGLHALQAVDFRSASMNPPFFRSFAALPLLFVGPTPPHVEPPSPGNDWATGYRFMQEYWSGYQRLFVLARCMVILTAALLGALVLQWATELYGWPAGLVALLLFSFSPNVLAHAHLVTLDLSGAVAWTAVAYLTWRLLDSPTARRAVALGLVLGLAPVLKLSGLTLPILVMLLVLVRAFRERDRRRLRWASLVSLTGLTTLLVLNGLYRFEGTAAPLGAVVFHSSKMRAFAAALPWLRLPLPSPLLKSLDVLFVGDEPGEPAYFLAGSWSLNGWRYYHLVAFLLKTPLPLLAGGLFGFGAWAAWRSPGRRDYCLFLSVVFVFAANALLNPLNLGVRHALPAYPLLAIAASPWLAAPLERIAAGSRKTRDLAPAAASIALLGWFLYGSVAVAPRYLQYFNELAGGPESGHRWLVDSNVDWGQDLIRLRAYMEERHLESVHLAYFGRVDPRVYGIRFTPLVEGASHGTAVVSASLLMGRPYWVWRTPGELVWSHNGAFTWLQRFAPAARVGSMFVYELP